MVNTKLKSDIANIDKKDLYDCNGLSSLTARTMLTGGYHDYLNLFFSDNVSAQHFYHRHQKNQRVYLWVRGKRCLHPQHQFVMQSLVGRKIRLKHVCSI